MDGDLKALLDAQILELESRIERVITQEKTLADKTIRLRSIPGIGPVSAAMLIAEMPELGKMTSGEAAAMTGLAPVPYDSGTMRGKRMIAGGRRALSGCTRRCLSQPCSQISRTTTERAWQTPQARYRRCRKKARNNRKRDPQKRRLMEPSKSNLDTAASSFFFDGSV